MVPKLRRWLSGVIDDTASLLARVFHIRRNRPSVAAPDVGYYPLFPTDAFFPEPDAPRDLRRTDRWHFGGLACADLAFTSGHTPIAPRMRDLHAGTYGPNTTAHVRWVRHTDGRPRPTALFLPSWMSSGGLFEESVALPAIARALDMDVARVTLPYHGRRLPRCSSYHGEYFWTADLTRTFEAIRQSVFDVRAMVRWFEQERGVPVGVIGQSLGGIVALAATSVESRLAFSIPIAAHLDLAGVLEDASLLRPMARELSRQGWAPHDVAGFMEALGLTSTGPAIPTDRILMVAGRHDRLLTAPRVEALNARWGRPRMHWYEGGHLGIYYAMPAYLPVARAWLDGTGLTLPAAATGSLAFSPA